MSIYHDLINKLHGLIHNTKAKRLEATRLSDPADRAQHRAECDAYIEGVKASIKLIEESGISDPASAHRLKSVV